MRKPSCVMYGHDAKASISFTKPLSRSDFNLLLLKKQTNKKGQEATLVFLAFLSYCFAVLKCYLPGCLDKADKPNQWCFGSPRFSSLKCLNGSFVMKNLELFYWFLKKRIS